MSDTPEKPQPPVGVASNAGVDVDHKLFETPIRVRQLCMDDYEQYLALAKRCFPAMEPCLREHVESQLRQFPEGQLVVDLEGRIVASCSSLIIEFDEYADGHTWMEIADSGYIRNHDPEGDTLYGIEIMVDPDYRGMKLARRLYEARKQLCRELNLRRIMIGGRIPGYTQFKDRYSAREYIEQVVAKNIYDPVLTAQLANGFVLKRLIRSYLGEDQESDGHATLLEWVNLDYRLVEHHRRVQSSPQVRICVVQYQMRYIKSFEDFAQQCEYFVDVASGYKSDFLLFPELFTTQMLAFIDDAGPPEKAVRKLTEMTPQYLELFSGLAVRYNVNIIGGSHVNVEGDKLRNTAYLFQRNGRIDHQHKLHITPNERRWWGVQPGDSLEVFDTDRGKICILICYDVEFPELTRIAVERGARILFVPFCTDERHGYLRVRSCAQARCIENQIYAAIAGTVGNLPAVDNMDIQYAQSAILTPSDFGFARDAVAAECTPNIETVVIHDVDLELLERSRQRGTVQNWNDRRQDLYEIVWKGRAARQEA